MVRSSHTLDHNVDILTKNKTNKLEDYKGGFEQAVNELQAIKNTAKNVLGDGDWFGLHHPKSYKSGYFDAMVKIKKATGV